MTNCTVCTAASTAPIYTTSRDLSITSLGHLHPGKTTVYFCDRCGHLNTPPLANLDEYYATNYDILVESDEEDQLYEVKDGVTYYRFDHQLDTLLRKVPVAPGARVLDYGCAKGATLKRLCERQPGIIPCLFDVSESYVEFWRKFCDEDRWAVFQVKPAWEGSFDVVLSFYAIEHVEDPREFIRTIASVLKPGGHLYLVLPNVYANIGDFIVSDHVNHFSASSLRFLLSEAGLGEIEIDESAHHSAYVVTARKVEHGELIEPDVAEVKTLRDRALEMSRYWTTFGQRVQALEQEAGTGSSTAVYGSGIYGTYIASCLTDPGRVVCFIDKNRYRWTKTIMGKPIVAPTNLPASVEGVYVGLNPAIARGEMTKVKEWEGRALTYRYP